MPKTFRRVNAIMEWIKIFPEDLEAALNKPQLDTLKAESLKSLKRDISFDIISSITAKIRAEIATSGLNAIDCDHSKIPPELRECALRLCVEALHLRVPSIEISQMQSRHADIARETLLRIAKGELAVTRPRDGVKTANPRKGISASSTARNASRRNMEGL